MGKREAFGAITSPITYLAITGIVLLSFVSSYQMIQEISMSSDPNAMYIFNLEIGDSWYIQLLYLLAALPSGVNFYSDWKDNHVMLRVIRTGKDCYIFSKIISCLCITFITMFIGLSIYTIGIATIYPFCPINLERASLISVYQPLVYQGNILEYVVIHVGLVCIGAMIWNAIGLLCTIFQPDIYVAITTPFVSSYIVCRIMYSYFPDNLNLERLVSGRVLVGTSEYTTLGFTLVYMISVLLLLSFGIAKQIGRRLSNEVI